MLKCCQSRNLHGWGGAKKLQLTKNDKDVKLLS